MAYVTLAQLKTYRGIAVTGTGDDVILQDCITRAQSKIETYTGRVFETATTASTHYFDAIRDVSDDKRTLYLDEDLHSITTVINGDSETVNDTAYVPIPRHVTPYYALRMKSNASTLWTYEDAEEDAIQVGGRWGYSGSAPADIQQATLRLANYMYLQKDATNFDVISYPEAGMMIVPGGIPRDVKETLDEYRRLR